MPIDLSTPWYGSYVALWLLVIVHSLLLLGVVRVVYQLQQTGTVAGVSIDSSNGRLKAGAGAPAFSAVDLAGRPISSTDIAGRLTALVFVSPKCPSCTLTLYEMEALSHKAQGNVVVICRAGREECTELAQRHKLKAPTVADGDDRISRQFGISSNPTAVLIDRTYRIQSYGYPKRPEDMESLLTSSAEAAVTGVS